MSAGRRIEDLESRLTPRQCVLVEVEAARDRFTSLSEFGVGVAHGDCDNSPLARLQEPSPKSGQHRSRDIASEDQACADRTFLFLLFIELNAAVNERTPLLAARLLLVLNQLERSLAERSGSRDGQPGAQTQELRQGLFADALAIVGEIEGLCDAIETLSQDYFGRDPLLFCEERHRLYSLSEQCAIVAPLGRWAGVSLAHLLELLEEREATVSEALRLLILTVVGAKSRGTAKGAFDTVATYLVRQAKE